MYSVSENERKLYFKQVINIFTLVLVVYLMFLFNTRVGIASKILINAITTRSFLNLPAYSIKVKFSISSYILTWKNIMCSICSIHMYVCPYIHLHKSDCVCNTKMSQREFLIQVSEMGEIKIFRHSSSRVQRCMCTTRKHLQYISFRMRNMMLSPIKLEAGEKI